eukprot:COSAG02_NODE_1241_length_13704_cov_3.128188_12_plen_265_part_00
MEGEAAPDTPEQQPDSIAAPSGSLEEATPTDKGILETQESVPQPGKKPSRPPPSRPAGGGGGNGGGGNGSKSSSSGSGSKSSSSSKKPSVPGRRPPSRPAPTPTPSVAPAALGSGEALVTPGTVRSGQLSTLQARLERLAQDPLAVDAEAPETEDGARECPPLSDEELSQLVNRIADLIDLRASLEQHAPLLGSWRSQFLAQSSGADVLSVLQQARAVSELVDASAFEVVESVTSMVRLSEGMESDRLFLLQLRRKYLADNLTL